MNVTDKFPNTLTTPPIVSVRDQRKARLKTRAGSWGVHLFSRATGLNILLEELHAPKNTWATAPRHVSVALTNACDLSCAYCFAPKTHAHLGFDQIIAWLHELDEHGCLGVGFGGGEPTLYRPFPELCRYAAQNTALAITFTTHGHHLNDRLIADLAGNVHFVRVSMDGIGATYEANRGRSFLALRQAIARVRGLSPFGINYVVNADTIQDLNAAATLAAEAGASEFLLLPEHVVSGRSGINDATTAQLRRWVRSYSGTVPLVVSEHGADGLPTCNPLPSETGILAYAHIDASGTLKRSSFDRTGVPINDRGVMKALETLHTLTQDAE